METKFNGFVVVNRKSTGKGTERILGVSHEDPSMTKWVVAEKNVNDHHWFNGAYFHKIDGRIDEWDKALEAYNN